jgi:hypothetical protein
MKFDAQQLEKIIKTTKTHTFEKIILFGKNIATRKEINQNP